MSTVLQTNEFGASEDWGPLPTPQVSPEESVHPVPQTEKAGAVREPTEPSTLSKVGAEQ